MIATIGIMLALAGMICAYLRGREDKAADQEAKCRACRLRLECVKKYSREAMRILEQDFDPTTPTARELDAQWGFKKKGA